MRFRFGAMTAALIAAAFVVASMVGGAGASPGAGAHAVTYNKPGKLVAKDSAKRRPATAVARKTLTDFQGVFFEVTTNPGHLPVDWSFTTRCMKGALIDYYPGPGDHRTKTKRTSIGGKFPIPLADPDFCTFAVSGQIHKNKLGKSVTVKIYKKG